MAINVQALVTKNNKKIILRPIFVAGEKGGDLPSESGEENLESNNLVGGYVGIYAVTNENIRTPKDGGTYCWSWFADPGKYVNYLTLDNAMLFLKFFAEGNVVTCDYKIANNYISEVDFYMAVEKFYEKYWGNKEEIISLMQKIKKADGTYDSNDIVKTILEI